MEIEEALSIIRDEAKPIKDTLSIPVEDAAGHITATDTIAEMPVPAFARSAMDGYAVHSDELSGAKSDRPVCLKVAGEILAGDSKHFPNTLNSAVRVMTGAMIPDGYDAVVRQEDTDYGEKEVRIYTPVRAYDNYCPEGEEIKKGEVVIPAGRHIGRVEAGLFASLGMPEVIVRRPAEISVISTGSELTDVGETLHPGRIYNSIRYMLIASIRQEKLRVKHAGNYPDDKALLCSCISEAAERSDIVITTGGVSVGKKDLIPEVLDTLGAKKLFSGINIQPGTPTTVSELEGKLILSLSGNPYAAMVNFDLYFWTMIAGLMGSPYYLSEASEAVMADPYKKQSRRRRFVRAREEGGNVYLPVLKHMSSVFGNMDRCNCYLDIPEGETVSPGDTVKIWRMR
ncbi:MAG: molybdopterin molybdotransferase MoeA [Lachnospiraceae bacterium]|nr:molybdopterin molybdotransferase MoeA [Lachnospiraceae bacterium]